MRETFSTIVLLALMASASHAAGAEHTRDPLTQIQERLDARQAVLVDVREQDEWDAGHLSQALLYPLSKMRDGIDGDRLAKDRIVYLHCKSGGRCLLAADILIRLGYDARPLKQGFEDLKKGGFKPAE